MTSDFEVIKNDLKWIKDELSEIKKLLQAQNGRIRKLEEFRSYTKGWACGITFIVAVISLIISIWVI